MEVLTKQELIELIRERISFDETSESEQVQNILLCRKKGLQQQIETAKLQVNTLKGDLDDLVGLYRIFHQRDALSTMVMLSNQIEMQSKVLETLTKRYEQLERRFRVES